MPCFADIPQRRNQFGEYHHLLQEQRLDDGCFQRYFHLSGTQFEKSLSHVGGQVSLRDTNYSHCTPAAEPLSICVRNEKLSELEKDKAVQC
ncbi:hypothetical protein CRENBAI_005990 [Crenichthys baileyi]|uniref:Uncharacterized protein n=1 Tax=Crenichthys baileyi TaxID=28760 RepID=A0AAV9SJJ3_9TELE